jgi:hypothetical protein
MWFIRRCCRIYTYYYLVLVVCVCACVRACACMCTCVCVCLGGHWSESGWKKTIYLFIALTPLSHTLMSTAHASAQRLVHLLCLTLWVGIMHCYSWTGLTDTHFVCGTARKSSRESRCVYQEQHARRHLPHHTTFFCDDRRLLKTGTLQ